MTKSMAAAAWRLSSGGAGQARAGGSVETKLRLARGGRAELATCVARRAEGSLDMHEVEEEFRGCHMGPISQ